MGYVTCVFCGTTTPESAFCPACGKAMKKWCAQCGDWKAAGFSSLEVDDSGGTGASVVLADFREEVKFCPECGAKLQAKNAAHE